jgi:hypothetical protein
MLKRVLTFSLWGDKPFYNVGAIKNAHLAQHFYPNFECWFYVHIETVPFNNRGASRTRKCEINNKIRRLDHM